MDDYTFLVLAKLKADRLSLRSRRPARQAAPPALVRSPQPFARLPGQAELASRTSPRALVRPALEGAVMRSLVAVAGSLIVNLAALGALQWSVLEAQAAPEGEVLVKQLPDEADLPLYARADRDGVVQVVTF